MLAVFYIGLRFTHFAALMMVFGCTLYAVWWAPSSLRTLFIQRFAYWVRGGLTLSALSTLLMFVVQGGLMGNGWADTWRPVIWQAVVHTQFGQLWLWQIILAWVAFAIVWQQSPQSMHWVLWLCIAQFILLAGIGHTAIHEGLLGTLHHINQSLHLLCASAWVGGLLPFLYCLQLSKGQWRHLAIMTMMRFSRYGHIAVAGVIVSGLINAWLIQGGLTLSTPYGRWLWIKCGGVVFMVSIALFNRYGLVPHMSTGKPHLLQLFIRTTQCEVIIGALVLACVSLFATWEPF